ncbi:MAG: DUF1015 family protein [Deltaproteobacteria bacterium]|nr:DUF1015 family protein [Deltaproteobacteria bacterium]MDQ3300573.1 DUF1015 domain-containing protein [Myxococcota bacterium]
MPQIAGLRGVLPTPASVGDAVVGSADGLARALADGKLVRDTSRAVYRYHQVFAGKGRTLIRKSLLCAVKLSPFSDGEIRPHETTVAAARDAALARIRANTAHDEPVLMGFRDPATEVERLCRKAESNRPTLEVTTADGTVHKIWRISDSETIGALRKYFAPKKLHVLDGHDRYEAQLAYHGEITQEASPPMYSSANFGLACLTSLDDPALAATSRHRVIRGAAKRETVFGALGTHFIVDKVTGAAKDVAKQFAALADTIAHQPAFIAVFAGEPDAWRLTLSPDVSPVAEGISVHRALQKLDPIVLQHLFLDRALPGAQVTTETNAEVALASGADLVLITRPLSVEQIAHVDELGGLLPAGSTAFHPPLARGLVSLVIDPDEDLV